ncbi:hypothetical protein PILCRDRAFT_179499 [Piloderma croceum F 1598]|uniref:Uncharacterized protein n=1 Tax=Piloderma croceum (strain F 1598) TaxID=765440 RepID=A0A0C3BUT7_PILCF|nr:hypothetical protein PILCRDRAFT_179499 [Piloderma croceum F 1598]
MTSYLLLPSRRKPDQNVVFSNQMLQVTAHAERSPGRHRVIRVASNASVYWDYTPRSDSTWSWTGKSGESRHTYYQHLSA